MDGSSSRPRPHNPPLQAPPTLYQVPPASGGQRHYRSLLQDHQSDSGSSAALPPLPPRPLPTSRPPSYQQLYPGVYYTPPFVPGLDPSADPIQHQPRIAQGQFVHLPEWQPDHLVRSCPICDSPFTLFFRRHHCRRCGRVVCAQCSSNRLPLPSSSVVRPPGELPPTQGMDTFGGMPSSQWGGFLGGGGSAYNSPGAGPSNRHSWAGSITSPFTSPSEQNSPGFFEWGVNDSANGMEDVRVCSDCYAGTNPQNDNRGAPGSGLSIHRTWNGSSSPTMQGRPSASELWGTPNINTPDANGRRRRQSLQGGRSLPYNYDPSTPPTLQNQGSYIPQAPSSGSAYSLPLPPPPQISHPRHYGPPIATPPHLQAKYASYFHSRDRQPGFSGSSRQAPTGVQIHPGNSSQIPQSQPGPSSHPQPPAHGSVRAKLKETDYCPICTLPLPPSDPVTGDETARETHIQDCIRSHEASTSPRANNPSTTGASPHTGGAQGSAPTEMSMTDFLNQLKGGPGKSKGRMVVYKAREEDTWDYSNEEGKDTSSENVGFAVGVMGIESFSGVSVIPPPLPSKSKHRTKAECVICFEEFEVGESIARLECLCRYHKSCIREWFDRKGNGDCPVHAVRE